MTPMNKSKVVVTFVILLSMLFLVFQYNENYLMADVSKSLIVPFITLLYFIKNDNKSIYFTLFLVLFSISDMISLFGYYLPNSFEYYLGNVLYIIAYSALSYEIILSIDIKYILKHFKGHLVVLIVLNIYTNYVLIGIEKEYISGSEFSVEFIYNVFTLLLLSVSLLNYFYRDDKKAFILFLGTLSIVVSEVIQIAYYYIPEVEDNSILSVSYSLLLILAFYLYYSQSKLEYDEVLVLA